MSNLTPKQEKFCNLYVELGNASEAYRGSYDTSANANSVNRMAKEMLDNPKISSRVQEIREGVAKMQLWSKEDSIKILSGIAKGDDPDARPTDKVNAVKALNSMHGWDKQTIDLTNSDGSLAPTRIELVAQHDHSQD